MTLEKNRKWSRPCLYGIFGQKSTSASDFTVTFTVQLQMAEINNCSFFVSIQKLVFTLEHKMLFCLLNTREAQVIKHSCHSTLIN